MSRLAPPVRKAVFPVGGLGTRFLPATKSMPKEMLPVVDKPLIHYAFEEAKAAGIEQFIFITGRNKDVISHHFDQAYELQEVLRTQGRQAELEAVQSWLPDAGNIIFIRQQAPRGLGHAVWCARHAVGDEPFAVLLADDMILSHTPCLVQMQQAYGRLGGNLLAAMNVPRAHADRYGMLNIDSEEDNILHVKGLVEKPSPQNTPSCWAVVGRYILQPEIFDVLEHQAPGAKGEIQLTDALAALSDTSGVAGVQFTGERFDCGSVPGFLQAQLAYALAHPVWGPAVQEMARTRLHMAQKQP